MLSFYLAHWNKQRCYDTQAQKDKQKRMDIFLSQQPDHEDNTLEENSVVSLEQ